MVTKYVVRIGAWTSLPVLMLATALGAQERTRQWERRSEPTRPPATAFHSPQVIALPTAVTLSRGEWQFEIAHRFLPAVSEGSDALWGLDGPVNMRLGMAYAPTDRIMVTVARSNLMDNLDLQLKWRALELNAGSTPILVALQGGAAWSSQVPDRDSGDKGNFQYYGQLILNTRLSHRLALGAVPSYLYNVLLQSADPAQGLSLGLYGQLFLNSVVSLNAEWNVGEGREDYPNDPAAFGIELETGGHFFKIFLTNSVRLNPSQYLAGTDLDFNPDEWRLGFAITRLLRF